MNENSIRLKELENTLKALKKLLRFETDPLKRREYEKTVEGYGL